MNQKTVIYIILSAILLYLYYRKRDLTIFVAFAVVVAGTLFAGASEGYSNSGKGENKECAKMGFTETKIDKKNPIGSLKKINDNFKKALLKYATFENERFKLKEESQELLKPFMEDPESKAKIDEQKNNKESFSYIMIVSILFMNNYNKSDSGEMTFKMFGNEQPVQKILDGWKKEKDGTNEFKKSVSTGDKLLKMIREVKDLDVMKNADKKTKEAWNFLICAIKHTNDNLKKLDKALSGDDDADDDADDDEKPKKNKKKATKKKKSDDENADEEDE